MLFSIFDDTRNANQLSGGQRQNCGKISVEPEGRGQGGGSRGAYQLSKSREGGRTFISINSICALL
jgi:hypothetical protein